MHARWPRRGTLLPPSARSGAAARTRSTPAASSASSAFNLPALTCGATSATVPNMPRTLPFSAATQLAFLHPVLHVAAAGLPAGVRLSDHISLGVIARASPPDRVRQVLAETGKASERDLPAQVVVYYAIALALYMGSSIRESCERAIAGGQLGRDGEAARLEVHQQFPPALRALAHADPEADKLLLASRKGPRITHVDSLARQATAAAALSEIGRTATSPSLAALWSAPQTPPSSRSPPARGKQPSSRSARQSGRRRACSA